MRDLIVSMLSNIIWHIETNRKTLGDERTLDDVYSSLKNMLNMFKGNS